MGEVKQLGHSHRDERGLQSSRRSVLGSSIEFPVLYQRHPLVITLNGNTCNFARCLAIECHVRSDVVVEDLIARQNWAVLAF